MVLRLGTALASDNALLRDLIADLERCLENGGATEFWVEVKYDCV
jgi:hypothetical protein